MVLYIPPKQSVPDFHVTRVQFFPLPPLSLEMYSFPLIISPLSSSLTNTNIDRKTDRQETHKKTYGNGILNRLYIFFLLGLIINKIHK